MNKAQKIKALEKALNILKGKDEKVVERTPKTNFEWNKARFEKKGLKLINPTEAVYLRKTDGKSIPTIEGELIDGNKSTKLVFTAFKCFRK